MARADSDPSVSYSVVKDGANVKSMIISQTTGSGRWVLLAGGIQITSGTVWNVTLTASGSGCARADTVKFVRTA